MLGPAFAGAIGAGYLPLLVLPWTFGALVTRGDCSESNAGFMTTLEVAALAFTSLVAAGLATRPRRRLLGAAGTAIAAMANVAAAVASPGSGIFLLARLCSGAGLGLAVAVGNATAAGSGNPTRAFSALWFLMALWQLLVFNATPWFLTHFGLAGVYGFVAGTCLLLFPLVLATPDPSAKGVDSGPKRRALPICSVASMFALTAFFTFWLRDALVYSMSERLAIAVDIDGQRLGLLLGIASVVGLSGPALAAHVGAGSPPRGVIAGSILLALGASVAMTLGISSTVFICGALLLPATGLFAASLLSGLAAEIDATGRLAAIGAGIGFISEAVGPAIGGSLIESGGRRVLFVAVLFVGLCSVVAAIAASTRQLRLRDDAKRRPDSLPLA